MPRPHEVAVIERFLPTTMTEEETKAAIDGIKAESWRDRHEGHGPGDGGAEGASRDDAGHGEGQRAGEGGAS